MGLTNTEPPTIDLVDSSDDQAEKQKPAKPAMTRIKPLQKESTESEIQMVGFGEEEDDSLICKKCQMDFWYRSELFDHMKTTHFIADPIDWLKTERMKVWQAKEDERKRKKALSWAEQEKKMKLTQEEKEAQERRQRDLEFKRLQKIHAEKLRRKMENDHREDLMRSSL